MFILKKFLKNNEEQVEKDAIKQKLLQKDSMRNAREQREKEENAEEIRKKILEQAVINETPNLKKNKKIKKTNVYFSWRCYFSSISSLFFICLFRTKKTVLVLSIHRPILHQRQNPFRKLMIY